MGQNDDKNNLFKKILFLLYFIIFFFNILSIKRNNKCNLPNINEPKQYNLDDPQINEIIDNKLKNLLQLYIENRTYFYILGREKIMKRHGKIYNESNIKTIQDKMNWLLIHENPEYKSKIVDKILLREYSTKILGEDICPPIIKIYDNVNQINLDELPNSFILKCNHGSGMNIFCKDKSKFNLTQAKLQLNNWMKINYGLINSEYVYINIKKKIFAEKYLGDDINVYKIDCYNGNPKFIRAYKHLPNKGYKIGNIYDLNWTLTDIETGLSIIKRDPNIIFHKPRSLNLMLEYAKKLSKEFVFVRVDFYDYNERIYLSELTFTTSNMLESYKNEEQSIYLGSLLDLTKIKNS